MKYIDLDVKAYVDYQVNQQAAKVQTMQASFGNVLSLPAQSAIGNPGAAPSSYIYQAILITALTTGIFAVGWDVPWNSGTTADSVTLAVKSVGWSTASWASIATTGKITLTGASVVAGTKGATVGGAINGGSTPNVYACTSAGTTITATVTGAGSATSTLVSAAFPTLTGLLTAQGMQWNSGAVVGNSANPTGYAPGSPVLIEFVVSATNSISMTGSAAFYAYELPPLA